MFANIDLHRRSAPGRGDIIPWYSKFDPLKYFPKVWQ